MATLLVAWLVAAVPAGHAAALTASSMSVSDPRPSQTSVTYTFQASSVTLSPIKCIKIIFATTSTGTTIPASMSTSSAALSGTSNYIPTPASWVADGSTTNGTVKITFGTGETPASAASRTVVLTGITNSATADTGLFAQFSTYNNTDCASSGVDNATVSYILTAGQAVSVTVDPSLAFTVAGAASGATCNGATSNITTTANTIPLGTPTPVLNRIGVQNLSVTTNAGSGYTVYARYTAKPTSGANTIADQGAPNSAPLAFPAAGTESYGYTTNDGVLGTGTTGRFTATGGNKWAAYTTTNSEVAYNAAAVSSDATCFGNQVGIAGTTPAGTYTTTVILTATPLY